MPDKVFCKDCEWFKEIYSPSSPDVMIGQQCNLKPLLSPITGKPHTDGSCRICEVANINYNCSDYKEKP
jgi:hypothetical protein